MPGQVTLKCMQFPTWHSHVLGATGPVKCTELNLKFACVVRPYASLAACLEKNLKAFVLKTQNHAELYTSCIHLSHQHLNKN